ncbi:MAG: tetratricopeptide repeat protein [Flavobacteriales bacterium]|nr:tetratricopeptide repeat protein [Flavobacteriales bacterium]
MLPNYANAYYNLGLTYEFEEQLNSAKAAYKQALVLQPDMDLAAEGLDRLQRRAYRWRLTVPAPTRLFSFSVIFR